MDDAVEFNIIQCLYKTHYFLLFQFGYDIMSRNNNNSDSDDTDSDNDNNYNDDNNYNNNNNNQLYLKSVLRLGTVAYCFPTVTTF